MPGRYHGVFPMLVTPFTPSGTIDDEDLRRLLDFVLGAGAHGVSILGLGGEASRLSSTERRAVARLVLSQAGGHRVIVGCSADETTTSMDLARDAVDHGASIVMLAPPSRPDWDRNRLLDHFQRVAEGIAPAPVMIQDAPAFVGVALDETFATDLARFQPSVLYAKPEGLPAAEWAVRLSSAGLAVFGGHGGVYAMDVFEAGAVGLIPGCEAPGQFSGLFDAFAAGEIDKAWRLFSSLLPLVAFEFQGLDFYIACVKHILVTLGILRNDTLRGVPDPMSPTTRRLLLTRATRAGVIPAGRRRR